MWMTSSDNYKLHTSLMIFDFPLAEIVTANASMSGFAKKHPHAQRDSPRCNVRKRPLGGCWPVAPAVPPVSAKVCQNFTTSPFGLFALALSSEMQPIKVAIPSTYPLENPDVQFVKRFTPAQFRIFQNLPWKTGQIATLCLQNSEQWGFYSLFRDKFLKSQNQFNQFYSFYWHSRFFYVIIALCAHDKSHVC